MKTDAELDEFIERVATTSTQRCEYPFVLTDIRAFVPEIPRCQVISYSALARLRDAPPDGFENDPGMAGYIARCEACKVAKPYAFVREINRERLRGFLAAHDGDSCFHLRRLKELL